jgi:hypothetical protein
MCRSDRWELVRAENLIGISYLSRGLFSVRGIFLREFDGLYVSESSTNNLDALAFMTVFAPI